MRLRYTVVILAALLMLFAGCSKKEEESRMPELSFTEKFTLISETDLHANYSTPKFKNMREEEAQDEINSTIDEFLSKGRIYLRKTSAAEIISGTDITEYSFSEIGNYKVHCCSEEYLSFSLSMEQRFTGKGENLSVRQNFMFNYDGTTGKVLDISSLFKNKDAVSSYIAQELYERLLNMGCLASEEYSDELFKDDVLDYCVIVKPDSKIAVVTTAGRFGLKLSAGAPVVEISIPEEYFI